MSTGARYYGKYRATVMNNLDPMLQGRIMVQLADRYGPFPSTWAMPAFPLASLGAGVRSAAAGCWPQVWVEFEAGDPDYPIWTGAFWGGRRAASRPLALAGATPATPGRAVLQTTTGPLSITLSDNPGAETCSIEYHGAGAMDHRNRARWGSRS